MSLPPITAPTGTPHWLAADQGIEEDSVYAQIDYITGHSRARRVYTVLERVAQVSVLVDEAKMAALDDWWSSTLQNGTKLWSARIRNQGSGQKFLWWAARWINFQTEMLGKGQRRVQLGRVSGALLLIGEPSETGPNTGELSMEMDLALLGVSSYVALPKPLAMEMSLALIQPSVLRMEMSLALESSYTAIHGTSGALQAGAATVAGSANKPSAHPTSGALAAGSASVAGAAALTAGFTPASLFGVGDTGGFWDFTDASTLFSDSGRTTPATIGNPIRGVTDKSGTGRHLGTGTSTILMQSGYAAFPGGVDGFTAPTGQVGSATNGYFCIVAMRPVVGADMTAMEADYNTGATRVTQGLVVTTLGDAYTVYFNSAGTSPVTLHTAPTPPFVSGTDYIYAASHDTAGGSLRVNRSVVASDAASATPNASASGELAVGSAWVGTNSNPNLRRFQGRMYAAFWINRQPTGPELTALEDWFGALIGI